MGGTDVTTVADSTALPGGNDKAGPLAAAIALISDNQQYTFNLHVRLILPIDGYVFWVRASSLSPTFLAQYLGDYNGSPLNSTTFNGIVKQLPSLTPAQLANLQFSINASLHVTQMINQEDDATYAMQQVAFTTTTAVENFQNVAPGTMWITTLPTGGFVGFGEQRNHYQLAGLWHYHGAALYSALATQIVDDPRLIHPTLAIVSNSLPFWLALSTPSVPVFPAGLSPLNEAPPYVIADVQSTDPLGGAPLYDAMTSQSQLVSDKIRFTMYGLNNNAALDFQQAILQGSLTGSYGMMNIPVPKDERKTQREFQVIAQKKTMLVEINYYQTRVRDIAQSLILKATIALTPTPYASPIIPDIGQ